MAKKNMAKEKHICSLCGNCCRSADIDLGEVVQDEGMLNDQIKWLRLHRCDTWKATRDGIEHLMLRIPLSCVNMEYDRHTRTYLCRDYKNRPDICKMYKCYE